MMSKSSKLKHKKTRKGRKTHEFLFDTIVPSSIVEQAKAFTAPRGRLEMGGLLIGHVDEEGRNVCAIGFFPEQIEATPGYCEFDGKWMAISANAISHANKVGGDDKKIPNLRVIGWIHTHPDIGIFLSGIDVKTFKQNISYTKDGRFVAVVVDPLREENGVFQDPNKPNKFSAATGSLKLPEGLKERYLSFLANMEDVRNKQGKGALPFIIPGDLRSEHTARGFNDDYTETYFLGFHQIKKEFHQFQERISKMAMSNIENNNDIRNVGKQQKNFESSVNDKFQYLNEEVQKITNDISLLYSMVEKLKEENSLALKQHAEATAAAAKAAEAARFKRGQRAQETQQSFIYWGGLNLINQINHLLSQGLVHDAQKVLSSFLFHMPENQRGDKQLGVTE